MQRLARDLTGGQRPATYSRPPSRVTVLRRQHSLLTASLLLVPIWAGWHLPLFFLLQNYRDLGAVGVPGFLIGLACGSIVLAWLYESAAGSVLIAAVWHGTFNLASATNGAQGAAAAVVSTGVMAGAVVIAWSLHRATRAGHLQGNGSGDRGS